MEIKPNNIYNGNCYELIKEIPSNSIDCIYTDIPYLYKHGGGIGNTSELDGRLAELRKSIRDISNGIDYSIFDEFVRVLKKINVFIWCSRLQVADIIKYFENYGSCDILVWCKTNPIPVNNIWLNDVEYCVNVHSKGVKVDDVDYENRKKWYMSSVNQIDKGKFGHPTIKPVEMVTKHLLNSTNVDDVVLDPFLGSGTTAKACKCINRKYIGFEIDKKYFEIAMKRLYETEEIKQIQLL